jgi:hypothetical protein
MGEFRLEQVGTNDMVADGFIEVRDVIVDRCGGGRNVVYDLAYRVWVGRVEAPAYSST